MCSPAMKRIYVDMDDVITRTTDTYGAIVQQMVGRQVRFEDLTTFDLQTSFGLTDDEYRRFFHQVHQPEVLMGFKPVPGALPTLARWVDAGHRVDIVTGRPPSTREASLAWLDRHQAVYTDFIMVDKYHRAGPDDPGVITRTQLADTPYDLAVEDSLDTALFLAHHMALTVLLYDRPWNVRPTLPRRITRVSSWAQIATTLI